MEPLTATLSRPAFSSCVSFLRRPRLRQCALFPQNSISARTRPSTTIPRRCSSNVPPARHTKQGRASSKITQDQNHPFNPYSQTSPDQQHIQKRELQRIKGEADLIFSHPSIPSEEEVLRALKSIKEAAGHPKDVAPADENDPASALLSINANPRPSMPSTRPDPAADFLSTLAYNIVKHPTVFITDNILSLYVEIQVWLRNPSTFPEVFALFATKPIPKLSSGRVTFKQSNPRALSAAVPQLPATQALKLSALTKDLETSLRIIESTFAMPAYQRSKIFRRAGPPLAVAGLTPIAGWQIASIMATWQNGAPPEDFATYAFAGLVTYVSGISMLGYVSLTTANDQMQRVTWALGMPLWERWVREEERAACDLVACGFGFKERSRWGEETGVEWQQLKDFLGYRGMILDKVSLMDGME